MKRRPLSLFTLSLPLVAAMALLVQTPAVAAQESPAEKPEKPVKTAAAAAAAAAKADDKPANAKPAAGEKKSAPSKPAAKPADTAKKGEGEDAGKAEEKPAAGGTHTVSREDLSLVVELKGVFEGTRSTPIAFSPKEWAMLSVVDAVPHGTRVRKGDPLITLDTEKLEEAIVDAEKAMPGSELALRLAEEELVAMEKATPLKLESARRNKMRVEEALAYFEDVSRAEREDQARYNVKMAEFSLEYAQEELDQLSKMYAADDLTEETEEIIIKRAENSVESAKRRVHSTRLSSERSLNTMIPREYEDLRSSVENAQIEWRKAEQTLPDALKKAKLDLAKQKADLEKARRRLDQLKADLAALTVTAPHDGIVYYGQELRGQWVTASTVEKKLRPGGKLIPHEIAMTIVDPKALSLRAGVPEAKLIHLREGQEATASPAADPDRKLKAKLETLSGVPLSGNVFDSVFALPAKQDFDRLSPGMNATLKLDIFERKKVLTVPKSAVHQDGDRRYVILSNGKERDVKIGKSNDKKSEVLQGLKEGDKIKS